MDISQQETILRAVVISSSNTLGSQPISPSDRQTAFSVLTDFKAYDGRMSICLQWLQQDRHVLGDLDVTVVCKLYALELTAEFTKAKYSKLSEQERLAIRQAVLTAARQHAPAKSRIPEARILGNKIASLLAGLVVRDFPQRWTSLMDDIFAPMQQGGLWYNYNNSNNDQPCETVGVKICLECLKLVAEDCTDSDFNAKISTSRRNDVLIGLNEVSSRFLPLLYRLLEHISIIAQSKASLHQMRGYLLQNQQTLATMTHEQSTAYQVETDKLNETGMLVADTLATLEKFCRSMPLDWIIAPQQDFSAAFLHLMREPLANIQLLAVECLEQLNLRGKLTYDQWMKLISELPAAISGANQQFTLEQEYAAAEAAVSRQENRLADHLTAQMDFHRGLSRLLATVVSSHISHVTFDKKILKKGGPDWTSFSNFLRLLVDMCHHPSGRIAGEQINMWITLLRDPQITKVKLLQPFVQEVLSCYMDNLVRIRWEDVDDQTHPQASLMEASWDDGDEYDTWIMDFRSKASQLFKYIGNSEPHIACTTISTRIQGLVVSHGNGEPRDHLHPPNQQLTQHSLAVRLFEAVVQPFENILMGLPSWSLKANPNGSSDDRDGSRAQIRASAQASMSELARTVVAWTPNYLWLKFRRAQLLEGLKHYWKYDPSTLLQGIDALLGYLRAPDDWGCTGSGSLEVDGTKRLSGEVVSLRKKSSIALVAVAKHVPYHLVPWLSQLSEATRSLLSSDDLLPTNRMHLYEFLSCVATAVEDPTLRANFVADVLSDAINVMESPETQEAISSVNSFLVFMGVAQTKEYPGSVNDAANVKTVTARFARFYSAFNQLLSVGKRCHEAAKKRPNGGIPMQSMPPGTDPNTQNFPDEGPVSMRDLSLNDPFVALWPRILPTLLKTVDVILLIWSPEHQAMLLRDRIQRYVLSISDDEAYLSRKADGKAGGVFGEGGTAGSIIPGLDRRDLNLAPKWSSWFNELRNACFQMLGMLAAQRVLFAPEMAEMFPRFVTVVTDPENLRAMEHRHFTQYLKQFIEVLMLGCPFTMYMTHLAPILGPVLDHIQIRLEKTWLPITGPAVATEMCRPLFTTDCDAAAALASRGGEDWFSSYYARSGLFVGDLDAVTAEEAVDKGRVEISRTFSDLLQTALALKGDWALVLANIAREDQAHRANDNLLKSQGPRNRFSEGQVNADGTPKSINQAAIDARKLRRISAMCHFLFLEHEQVAGSLTVTAIQCLTYPDAYTCRRMARICHRILEAVAWHPRYTELLGSRMMSAVVKNIVTEPKWMVGIEWEMINIVRDIYGRLVLGQIAQPGGQGAGLQQPTAANNPSEYEQAKSADRPLQGGGILTAPSDIPRRLLLTLPGIDMRMVNQLEADLKRKRSAKDQKDFIRDFLREAADCQKEVDQSNRGAAVGAFDRAAEEESLLHRDRKTDVEAIPEKLVTYSMLQKKAARRKQTNEKASPSDPSGLAAFNL